VIEGLLCLLLLWTIAGIIGLSSNITHAGTAIELTSGPSPVANNNTLDNAVLSSFDPFNARARNIASLNEASVVNETALEITLLGIRQSIGDTSRGSAIIRLPDNRERVFGIGEEIIDGAELWGVHATHVEISRRGRREILYLLGRRPSRSTTATTPRSAASVTNSNTLTGKDLIAFAKAIDLEPRRNGRTVTGWIVSGSNITDALATLGLQEGDILTAFNDVRLRKAETFTELVEEIGDARRLVIRLERDSKPIELIFGYKAR
jgi:type II secretion system protein C